eukprot:scaffold55325_cov22-Tisochrysis_lutea.AAC.1
MEVGEKAPAKDCSLRSQSLDLGQSRYFLPWMLSEGSDEGRMLELLPRMLVCRTVCRTQGVSMKHVGVLQGVVGV